ncbi:MAG: B3/4 domain-containing protein [Candidatus Hadarchaeaceae archaeon]
MKLIRRLIIFREGKIEMVLKISSDLVERFPGLQVLVVHVNGLRVEKEKVGLQQFKEEVIEKIKQTYDLAAVKDVPIFRAYRDFFWRIGIDPTKNRPAAEALIRRVLAGKPLPTINTLVDAYNLASIKTCIAIGAFDASRIHGDLVLRLARKGEEFTGIGMEKPMVLDGKEAVVSDSDKLIAVYPYRDADDTKVTLLTREVILLMCGAPGIDEDLLKNAGRTTVEYITRFCGSEEGTET